MIEVQDLGLIEYSACLKIQEAAVRDIIDSKKNKISFLEKLIICEHEPVVTVGRAAGASGDILSDSLPVFEVTRGGRSTLHLPGQIIVYPILDLDRRGRDLHKYMRVLEQVIIDTLQDFRIVGESIPEKTGVWVPDSKLAKGEGKIASIGIAAKEWVSYHGIAVNVTCDLSEFRKINPCGLSPDVMTSVLSELSDEYKKVWAIKSQRLLGNVKTRLKDNMLEQLDRDFSHFGKNSREAANADI